MEIKYILSIIAGGIFFIALFVFVICLIRSRKKQAALMEYLEKMYSDKNLVKMDYDLAAYDEETAKLFAKMQSNDEGQITIEDVIGSAKLGSDDTVFGKLDTEGPEEITGNYKPN